MRDINRIKPFCDELAELWSKCPDLRFGQIMSNIARCTRIEDKRDIFNIEDDELIKMINKHLSRWGYTE